MSALAALVLGLLLPAREGPYVVLRADGTEIRLMEAPEVRGGLLVGRLWPNGPLVSFPARDVDARRTSAANRAGSPVPAGSALRNPPSEVAGPLPRPTPVPLGEMGKLNRSRAEAEKELQKASGTGKRAPGADMEAAAPRAQKTVRVEHLDVNGRDEVWWRARARPVRAELESAKAELAVAEEDSARWERSWMGASAAEQSSWAWEVQQRRDAVGRAHARLSEAERRMTGLEEEARKADAYPGWLR